MVSIHDYCADKVFVVAEIGNNHEGSLQTALEMVEAAAKAGADAVKFQTFIPEHYCNVQDTKRLETLKRFQLSFENFELIAQEASNLGITFFSTPFDIESANFLNNIQELFKISSGDNTFSPLIRLVKSFKKPTIISTGMIGEKALDSLVQDWQDLDGLNCLALMHCVSAYPASLEIANIRRVTALKNKYLKLVIGYSDHTIGNQASTIAVGAGARIIEKHFTLDHDMSDFRDHKMSANPIQLKQLIEEIRNVEIVLGNGSIEPQDIEIKNEQLFRRSIVSQRDIQAGTPIESSDLTWVRPGGGQPPGKESIFIGSTAKLPIKKGDPITLMNTQKN